MPQKTVWLRAWRVITASLGFALAFFLVHLPHGPEHWSADLRTALLADRLKGQHPRIVIVEVTERTLAENDYVEPVDRRVLATILHTLDDADVKIIALDFIFDRHTEPDKDKDLLEAIKNARAQVILGALDERTVMSAERKSFQSRFLTEAARPFGHLYFGEHHSPVVISDQVVREMADPAEFPACKSFAELIARADGSYQGPRDPNISWLRAPDDGSQVFLTLSAEDVLGRGISSALPLKEMLRGKIVLVGGNFPDRDQHLTPFSVTHGERYPGIFVHAQALAQLSDPSRRPIHSLSWPEWLIVVSLATGGGFLVGRWLRPYRLGMEVASIAGFIILSVLAFLFGRFVFPFIAVVLGWGWGEMVAHFFGSQKHTAR